MGFSMEMPQRLTPTSSVARDLYLRSGNRCAFPGCRQPLMTQDGVLVGEIAHIEAALPSGPRFRASMTNEERRAFGNLLLMCGTHHTIIDKDIARWTIERLTELKKAHEAIYTGAVDGCGPPSETSQKAASGAQLAISGSCLPEILTSLRRRSQVASR